VSIAWVFWPRKRARTVSGAATASASFRLSRVSIGAENFLGNMIVYPSQAKTGDNCLLGTKVLVPLDGPVREGVGLLGGAGRGDAGGLGGAAEHPGGVHVVGR
jgi:hypothetical protein